MADVKEYIVRIKGDTSQLEAAADRAQAKFEKLSDTEVRLKVNFGKNNADIKPLLNEIKKVDPEIHTKMVIDGLEELRQTEERLEQIKKMEKDIGSGSVDAIRASLEKKFKDIQEAEKEAGTLDELDNSKVASGLKDVLNYIESIGKAADDVTISPLIKQIREFAGWYEDELAGFKPQNLLDQKDELQNRLSSLSKSIGDIPEQDQIEARISKYIDELYGIEDRIDAGLESDSSNLIKKLKEASDYLDQIEKKYGKIEGSDLVDELKGIRRERAAELDDYISRNSKGKKKEKAVKNKEIEKKDEPIDDDTFDSWLDEMDQEVKKTEKLTEARKEAEKNLESVADSVDKESGSSDALIDANNQIGESAKEAEQKIKELENAVAELMSITSNASGGKLAIGEMIRNWIDSDKDIINRSGIKALLERSAVLDKDGNIYGGYSYGKAGKTGVSNATKERMKSSGVSPWAEFHSHSSAKIASASEADFIQFIKDYKEYGIAMQGIIAQDDIELFDMAAIMRDHKDKLEGLTKEDLIKKFKEGSLVSASSYFEDFISQYASNGLEEGLGYLGIALKNNGVDINLSDFKTIATDMMRDPNNKLAITELLINAVTGSMKDPSALNSQLESVIAQHTSGSTLASYFGYNDEDIQHYRRKAASKSIFQELFGTEDLSKYITHYTPDEFIEQNPLKLPDLSANENSMRNYAKATEEAADATAKLNKEEEKSVDNSDEHRKQQELAREYNEQLYESKGALPSPDDYDSYYDSEGISRFIEQTKEARIETENLNDAIRDGSVQSDDISKHTEDLKEDSKAANENAEANKKAAEAKKESASVQQEPERDLSAESLDLDKEASLRRLDVLEKKLREVGGASKELENDLVDARKAIGSAVDTKELGVANKKVRNITDDVNEYIKQKNIEVDYSDQLSSFEKLKNEIVESTAVSKAFKDSVKGAFDSFKDASASTKNIERIKEAIKETTKEFKEYAKASAADNSKANTRFSNYVDRLNSYDLDKYTPEVRQKILDLRDEISKMPKDAAGNFKIDLNDEEVVKQVNRIDGAMKDLKAAVSSADGVVANGISVKKLNEQMAQFVNKNHKLTAEYKQEVKELRQALSEEGLTKSGYMDILGQYKDLQARASDEGLVGGVGNLENLGNQIKRMSTNFVAQYFSLYDIVRYAKEIGQSVTEINSAQTELRKVSDASQTRIQENFKTSAETAQELGATISDVIKSTSDWARLGYSVDDAETLARNTTLFQTVGDNLTQESASEYLTSIMKGYQYEASDTESIIDKVNEVNLAARLYRNLQIRIGCGLILLLFINPQIAGTPQSQSA